MMENNNNSEYAGFTHAIEKQVGNATQVVKRAVDTVEDTVSALSDKTEIISMDVKKFGSTIPSALSKPLDKAKSAMEKKVEGVFNDLESALPTLSKAGFVLHEVDLDLGAIPQVIPRFQISRQITEEEKQAVLHEASANRFTKTLLDSLLKTQLLSKLHIGSLGFHQVEIHLGAIPKVKIRFGK